MAEWRGIRSIALCGLAALVWSPVSVGQPAGLPPEWEVRKTLAALVEQTRKLKPILEEVKPGDWTQKGAPETYRTQWTSINSELGYLIRSAEELSNSPERLTLALEAYFRMQTLEGMLDSLEEGVRKYQNPALADLLQGAVGEQALHREKLRAYIMQLAVTQEQELKVMNEEAQRCRTQILRQHPDKPTPATHQVGK